MELEINTSFPPLLCLLTALASAARGQLTECGRSRALIHGGKGMNSSPCHFTCLLQNKRNPLEQLLFWKTKQKVLLHQLPTLPASCHHSRHCRQASGLLPASFNAPRLQQRAGDRLQGAAERVQVLSGLVRPEKKKKSDVKQECGVQTSSEQLLSQNSDTKAEWVEITLGAKTETSQPADSRYQKLKKH